MPMYEKEISTDNIVYLDAPLKDAERLGKLEVEIAKEKKAKSNAKKPKKS